MESSTQPIHNIKIKRIMAAKFIRVFISSLISIILPVFLLNNGYTLDFVGLITSLVILSNIPFNILLTFFIKKIGERKLLLFLSILMALSSILFVLNWNPTFIVIASFIGLISVNGTETGPFQSIDQSILSGTIEDKKRTSLFSIYNFIGYTAMSLGSLLSGLPDFLSGIGFDFQWIFYIYAMLALSQGIIYYSIKDLNSRPSDAKRAILTKESKKIVLKLSLMFSIDAFGGGFIVKILLATWFLTKYGVQLGSLSLIFYAADVITAFSIFIAPRIAKRIGLLKTMIVTHLPSNIFLILVPFAPTLEFAIALLFIRQSISQMDVPTRQSYVNAIVQPEDRASAAAITNTSRTIAQSISPPLATSMIGLGQYTLPFVFGGGIKIIYDILIYFVFRQIKPPEEQRKEEERKKTDSK
jgi:MFS family permease